MCPRYPMVCPTGNPVKVLRPHEGARHCPPQKNVSCEIGHPARLVFIFGVSYLRQRATPFIVRLSRGEGVGNSSWEPTRWKSSTAARKKCSLAIVSACLGVRRSTSRFKLRPRASPVTMKTNFSPYFRACKSHCYKKSSLRCLSRVESTATGDAEGEQT